MKSVYKIIIALGCLISSGSYAMAPEDVENLQATRQALIEKNNRQQCNRVFGLISDSDPVEDLTSFLGQNPEIKTTDHLTYWLAIAEGVEQGRQAVSHLDNPSRTERYAHRGSALVKLTLALGVCTNPLLIGLMGVSGMADFIRAEGAPILEAKFENARAISRYLANQPDSATTWFDEQNENVARARQLIETSNNNELEQFLEERAHENSVKANLEPLHLLAITVGVREAVKSSRLNVHRVCSVLSGVGAIISFIRAAANPTPTGTTLNSLVAINGGEMQLQVVPAMLANSGGNYHAVYTLLQRLRDSTQNEEIRQAQRQVQREALQRQLAQVQQEREETRAALRPLIQEEVQEEVARLLAQRREQMEE